jgi:hypothetical protein
MTMEERTEILIELLKTLIEKEHSKEPPKELF